MFKIKRIYEPAEKADGYRILIDRLWPRGVSKEAAKIDLWLKEIAPSEDLRTWFSHDSAKWDSFEQKYQAELKSQLNLIHQLKDLEKTHHQITLLFGAKDILHNNAVVLLHYLMNF